MPRNRSNPKLAWLPDRVYIQRNKYVYQPKSGGKVTLCGLDAPKSEVIKRYEDVKNEVTLGTFFKHIIKGFFNSPKYQELAYSTRKDYEGYRSQLESVFGNMRPDNIRPYHVNQFIEALAITRGSKDKPANATANRHKACLQKICSWAVNNGKMKINPCVGVSKLKEKSRDRYITDQEYKAIYDNAPSPCQVAMEIAYLCMARISDVLALTMRDMREEGIFIEQSKTGVKQIKEWSPRLRAAVDQARALPRKSGMTTIYLISKPDGSPYAKRTIQMQYDKAKKSVGILDVTFHDLKAKSISDFKGNIQDKQHAAGHTNSNQTRRYDRKVAVVPTLGSKSK